MKQKINIVWFKRDLRLKAHLPLKKAIEENLPILLLYIFELSLISAPYSDGRHWRFVVESLNDMNNKLKQYHQSIHILYGEAMDIFRKLIDRYNVIKVFLHQETGTG